MKPMYVVLGILALVVVVGIGGWISTYGALNTGNQAVKESWSNVQSTLQRRADLIPNLVNTVKGYATHEEKTLTEVTEARAKLGSVIINTDNTDPAAMKQLQEAQSQMAGALSHLIAVAEQYPNLKADQSFLDLQSQLEGTENRINVARERYNEDARNYNVKVNGFFARFIANSYGFKPAEYFEAAPEAQKAPEVKF
ncbi:MAG TPA: LemA family protein [Pirellulales bacterium]|nr:LemA family protein [Pirellulales bacterium]